MFYIFTALLKSLDYSGPCRQSIVSCTVCTVLDTSQALKVNNAETYIRFFVFVFYTWLLC